MHRVEDHQQCQPKLLNGMRRIPQTRVSSTSVIDNIKREDQAGLQELHFVVLFFSATTLAVASVIWLPLLGFHVVSADV